MDEDASKLSRREFIAGTAALSVSAAYAGAAKAQSRPVKGGHLVLGLGGGGTTDSYDPATFNGEVLP